MSQVLESGGPDGRVLVLRDGRFVGVLRDHDVAAAREMVRTTGRYESPDRSDADRTVTPRD